MEISNKQADLLIITGETSGDNLGAELINQLNTKKNNLNILAMGGNAIKKAGAKIIVDSSKMGIIGFIEIIKHIGVIWSARKTILNQLKTNPPKLLILIDYPGFNLMIAKHAKKLNIKVLYYVSPQIWAWRSGRIHKIKKRVDHMAVLFPFEQTLYEQAGIPATYVGHPLAKKIQQYQKNYSANYDKLKINPHFPVIALLPGSRNQEIESLLPTMIEAAKEIKKAMPNIQFILAQAETVINHPLFSQIPNFIKVVKNDTYAAFSIADAAICTSGTVTLECALFKLPQVIIYKVSQLTYWIGRCVIKTKHIGLCNIVAENNVAEELIQNDATPKKITKECIKLLNDTNYRQQKIEKMTSLQNAIFDKKLAGKVADLTEEMLAD